MDSEVVVAARVSRPVYALILKRQGEVQRATGIKPTVSAVIRLMLEESASKRGRRREAVR